MGARPLTFWLAFPFLLIAVTIWEAGRSIRNILRRRRVTKLLKGDRGKHMTKKPKPPRGPRNLKAGGFTNGLWRLEERAASLPKSGPSVAASEAANSIFIETEPCPMGSLPGDLKRGEVLNFEDGTLSVKTSGHGDANGWATLSFPERQVEIEDGCHIVEIAPSELRALRDFLNRVVQS